MGSKHSEVLPWLNKVHVGDTRHIMAQLPDNCVHTILCSPPYWGLRNYQIPETAWGGDPNCDHQWDTFQAADGSPLKKTVCARCKAWKGNLGLEPDPRMFIDNLVEVFRHARRILHPSGTAWVNLGDSYASFKDGKCVPQSGIDPDDQKNMPEDAAPNRIRATFEGLGIKNKDMLGMPWEMALALRRDGWWLRSEIIWHKGSAMPESIRDRVSRCHEQIFLFTKAERYFYDAFAIREPVAGTAHPRGNGVNPKAADAPKGVKANSSFSAAVNGLVEYRNKRSVWTVNPDSSGDREHYATYPLELISVPMNAGTSEHGVCAECYAPYKRMIEPTEEYAKHLGKGYHDHENDAVQGNMQKKREGVKKVNSSYKHLGWERTCKCPTDEIVPAVVFDPFMGSGTSGLVAAKGRRNYIGTEISPVYANMAQRRIDEEMSQLKLL